MKIKVLFIDENGASFVEVENSCDGFNSLLKWDDCWNTPTIRVWGDPYVCVCSDRGKIRHEPVSCISLDNLLDQTEELREPFIVGNVIITKFDGTDDFESLTDHDIEKLRTRLYKIPTPLKVKDFFKTLLILDQQRR